MLFTTKQGADGAEQAQAIGCDYATGAHVLLNFFSRILTNIYKHDIMKVLENLIILPEERTMKKSILTILLCCVLVCVLVACNSKVPDTVDDIAKLFDEDVYYLQKYDTEMIASIRAKLTLNGDILTVVHLIDEQSSSSDNPKWAYIYEFSDEADAEWFEENRRAFVTSTEENGLCVRRGCIVVFGSAPEISLIAS